jgi:two-component system, NarL family, sensor kinase
MHARKCKPHILILLCLVLLSVTACHQKKEQHNDANIGCDTNLVAQYKSLVAKATDPAALAIDIQSFYQGVPDKCHNTIVRPVMENLFNVVYTNQSTDTIVIPFLKQLSQENTLTIQNRTKALYSISAYYLYAQKNTSEGLIYVRKAKEHHENMNDTLLKTYNSLMGQAMMLQANLQEAAAYYLKTIELCEKLKDSVSLAGNYANYGTVISRMGDHTKAIEMKKKATEFFLTQSNNANNLFIGYIGIGTEFGEMRQYDSALYYYKKALDLTEKGVQDPTSEFDLLINTAAIYMGKSDYEQARVFYGKAKETLAKLKDEQHDRVYTMASTPAFADVKNVDEEIAKIKSYIPAYFEEHNIVSAKDAYYCLYHIYYLQDKNDLALTNYRKFDSLKNILAAEDNKQYVAEMEAKYETQKKELKIQVQQKELKQKNILNGFLLALLGVAIMAAALIITRFKLKKNKRDAALQQKFTRQLIENTEEERMRIARDLHDGVSQELLVLKNQIRNNQENTNEKIDFIINEIRMISRDLHPVLLDKIGLKSSVQHICEQMMENNRLFITADIEYHNGLDQNGELQLFRMVQEALNNIVKYAEAEAAKVTIRETDKYIKAEIIDNGKGFDVQSAMNSKTSFGLLNLMERSKVLNGKTEISSSAGSTIVKIEIPKSNV